VRPEAVDISLAIDEGHRLYVGHAYRDFSRVFGPQDEMLAAPRLELAGQAVAIGERHFVGQRRETEQAKKKRRSALYHWKMIQVTVNGAAHRFDRPVDVSTLLSSLRLAGRKVAVERNGEIVPKSAHAATLLADGDRLEIVVAVGGG
jgi:sulfur carrier protein